MTIPKFTAFEVKKYRSLMDVKIDMSDEMPVIICGENNIGKTNFLRALNLYFNHVLTDDLFNPKIDIPHHIYEGSRGAGSKTELIGYFSENENIIKLSVTFKDNGEIIHYKNGELIDFDVAKEFLIQFNYFYIESHNIDIPKLISAVLEKDGLLSLDTKRAKQSKSLEALKEFIRLSSEAISDIEKNINVVFKKFTDFDGILKGKSVRISFAEFDKLRDAIKNMTSITLDDGNSHGMASKGSGAQRAVFISLMQFISQNTKRKVIWGIDEPEAFLQPKLQKRVFEVFQEIVTSKKQPVIITTHSQHFIKLNKLTTTHIFKGVVEKRIYQRRPSEVFYEIDTRPIVCTSDSEKANHIKEHLGISNNDGWQLMPINMLVEGLTDKKYFETLFKFLGLTQPNIIFTGGAAKIGGYLEFYDICAKDLPYKAKIICLFDHDDEGREQSKKIKPNIYKSLDVSIKNLMRFDGEISSINSKDKDWEIEDLLPPNLILQVINSILKQEKYKKINPNQFADRVKVAHLNKQILKYAQECTTHNNPDKPIFTLENAGRKLQICDLFCKQIESNQLQLTLSSKQKTYLHGLLN